LIGDAAGTGAHLADRTFVVALVDVAVTGVADPGEPVRVQACIAILRQIGNAISLETGRAVWAPTVTEIGEALAIDTNALQTFDGVADRTLVEPIGNTVAVLTNLAASTIDGSRRASSIGIAAIDRAEVTVVAIEGNRGAANGGIAEVDGAGVAIFAVDVGWAEVGLADAVDTGRALRTTRAALATGPRIIGTGTPASLGSIALPTLAGTAFGILVAFPVILDTEPFGVAGGEANRCQQTSGRRGERAFQKPAAGCSRRQCAREPIEPITVH
jgi:hypothetical protein